MVTHITKADIKITVKYEVDCVVCGAGVEPDEDFYYDHDAIEARDRHIQEHADGEWG